MTDKLISLITSLFTYNNEMEDAMITEYKTNM